MRSRKMMFFNDYRLPTAIRLLTFHIQQTYLHQTPENETELKVNPKLKFKLCELVTTNRSLFCYCFHATLSHTLNQMIQLKMVITQNINYALN